MGLRLRWMVGVAVGGCVGWLRCVVMVGGCGGWLWLRLLRLKLRCVVMVGGCGCGGWLWLRFLWLELRCVVLVVVVAAVGGCG